MRTPGLGLRLRCILGLCAPSGEVLYKVVLSLWLGFVNSMVLI